MKNKIKVLKYLIENKEEISINKIANALKMNYKIAYEEIVKLEKEGIVDIRKLGNSNQCKFNFNFNDTVFKAEYERRKEFLKNQDFLIIQNDLAELKFSFIALMFGSQVKGTATKHSDIDILTIGGNEKLISRELSISPDKIHLTSITVEDFINMKNSKEFSVVSETIKDNVILIGIEEYYRLLNI